jgi:hypothetical protein
MGEDMLELSRSCHCIVVAADTPEGGIAVGSSSDLHAVGVGADEVAGAGAGCRI